MIRSFVLAGVFVVSMSAALGAQQAAESVNVMPVWVPCDLAADPACASDPRWADAWRYGDIFLQRQVEGSLAPSSLNPNRILTGFIDYSAVDTFSDTGLGDTVAQNVWTRIVGALARLFRLPQHGSTSEEEEEERRPKSYAGTDAWIRLTWSTNGGATSTPFFMPGAPWDASPAGQSAPYYQTANASSDPVVVAAPNGDFHVIFMAFRRGETNWIVDGRFRDLNIPDQPARHGLTFLGFTTLASGNNASFGTLHDKPHALAVVNPASPAGYDIYVSYTLFNGNPGGSKFQSQLFVARSSDGGVTFTTDKINQSTNENSGTWLVAGASGQVFAFWRGFGSSPAIYFVKQASGGWTKAKSILGNPALAAFDQGNIKVDPTNLATSERNITPRSNAFPSAAVAADGTIFVVFQECADAATGSSKACALGGSPRIMMTASKDGGATWTTRKALDNGARTPEADGLGYFWNVGRDNNAAHPQLMPSIACGAGQCLVTYWESRTSALSANGWIGGYHRIMDLRGASLKADGTLGRSLQLSRYPYRPGTKLVDPSALGADGKPLPRAENVNDIARVNETINLDGTRSCTGPAGIEPPLPGLEPGCVPRLNFYCRPQSGGGTTCFMGDYNAVVPATSFVKDAGGTWKAPTTPQEVPFVGFLTASSDNRNLVPPAGPLPSRGGVAPTDQLSRFTAWTPGANGLPACSVGGSRNTDLLLSKVNFGLLVTAPVTAKTVPSPGDEPFLTFPLQVWNNSASARTVSLAIDPPGAAPSSGSFSKTTASAKSGTVVINAYSSTTREIYATTTSPIRVQVSDGTTTTGITFNGVGGGASTPSSPGAITVTDPLNISAENISAENISAENISAENISAENISAENISAENISAENISAENLGVQETTWVIQASGDPTKAYTALANVDKAYSSDYDFHVVIYRLSSVGACVDTNGRVSLQYSATVVANTGAVNISAENISAENISAENISAENGFPSDTSNILNNSVFTPKPSPAPASGSRLAAAAAVPADGYRIGEGVEAQPPEREFTVVKLIAIPKKPLSQITTPYSPASNPASLTVASYWCDQNCTPVLKGSDLVVGAAPSVAPASVDAGLPLNVGPWSVANAGTFNAGPRRYGYYLSSDATLDLLPTGLVDTSKDLFLGSADGATAVLAPGASDTIAPTSVTIPLTTPPGTWHLFLYADDLRKVSELNENNNILDAGVITITGDTIPPVIDAHAGITAEATGPSGATITYASPSAIDDRDGPVAVTCTPASGSIFPLGATTVTCSAKDAHGNAASTTFAVQVIDTTPPVLTLPAPVVAATSLSGASVTYVASAVDLVDGARPVTCTPSSGSTFAIGMTTVTCSASDTRGNTATRTFVVTVNIRYGFIGVQNLPPPPGKTFNPGSAVPLKWQFTVGGVAVNSSAALPIVTITGPNGSQTSTPADPGTSSYQPPTAANGWTWQFNWQSPATTGSYSVIISSGLTGDSFNGGVIKLK
jgi:hypothetical protein